MKLVHAILYAVAFVLFHLVRLLFEGVRFFVRLGDIVAFVLFITMRILVDLVRIVEKLGSLLLDPLETWLRWHYNRLRRP